MILIMVKVILASKSPRRRELLTQMGVDFEVVEGKYDEHLDDNRLPAELAVELALGKALAVSKQHPDAVVIGADTIVVLDNKQLGKPADKTQARRMLQALSGRDNLVITAVAVVSENTAVQTTAYDSTIVHFRPYEAIEVEKYIATGDWSDKAGGYGIQSGAAPLISHISGNLDNVIGLPTETLARLLATLGVQTRPVVIDSGELFKA